MTEIIETALGVDADAFDDDTAFGASGLDVDSITIVEIAEMVDIELGVHVPNEDLGDLETVGDLKAYVREHR
ncbi:hypothetical protein GCM10025298_26140 [Natronobiforma cellulositropha]